MRRRSKYVMSATEKNVAMTSILSIGAQEYYNVVRNNALLSMDRVGDSDEVLLDMAETMLEDARHTEYDENNTRARYLASSIFRTIAHEINRILISKGKERGGRFLYLASNNPEAPTI